MVNAVLSNSAALYVCAIFIPRVSVKKKENQFLLQFLGKYVTLQQNT